MLLRTAKLQCHACIRSHSGDMNVLVTNDTMLYCAITKYNHSKQDYDT